MIEHLKSYLGKPADGWINGQGNDMKIFLFKNQPQLGISTYSTFQMSNHILDLKNGKKVRQELIVSVYERYETDKIPGALMSFAEHILETGKGLLRGEVVGPGNPFIRSTDLVGVYVSAPAFFEDNFHIYEDLTPPVVIVWLIPVLSDEIDFIRVNGWTKFENILEQADCDFWDIHRKSVLNAAANGRV